MRRFSPARRNVRLFITGAALAAALFMLIFITCDQASLFYNISVETAPISSIIPGHPSKIVQQGNNLYVANGDLWEFDGSRWEKIISMDDKGPEYISDVAASDNGDVYYLTREHSSTDGDTARIYKMGGQKISDGTKIGEGKYVSDGGLDYCQNIFCANNTLFSSGPLDNATDGGPQRYDNGTWPSVGITGLLKGVVYVNNNANNANGSYYYATSGNGTGEGGLWKSDSNFDDIKHLQKDAAYITDDIIGIIDIDSNYLAAVSSGNTIYQIDTSDTSDDSVLSKNIGSRFTGALGVWTNPQTSTERLLLVGYYYFGQNYDNGYREIVINNDGTLDFGTYSMPGDTSNSKPYTTISGGSEKFRGLMGKRIINSIIQYYSNSQSYSSQDTEHQTAHPMFASTQKDGLYSYRWRNNNGWVEEWNGEE